MKSLHIRDVDPNILAALKRLAKSHRRSLQGELHTILERARSHRTARAARGDVVDHGGDRPIYIDMVSKRNLQ